MKTEKKKKQADENTKPLTQEELMRWWPFTRLELHRFPKEPKQPKQMPQLQEALM